MTQDLDQATVIDYLNQYLKWHNMPIEVNRDGICNGIATVYIQYALQGKEKKFWELIEQIVSLKPKANMEAEINQFVYDVVLALHIEHFGYKLSQSTSMQALTINNKSMYSSFDFAITTSTHHWQKILKEIDLRPNEMMKISSTNHSIAIKKTEKGYRVFDPNYSKGVREFADEIALVHELYYNVFNFRNRFYLPVGPMGMSVSIIRHPEDMSPRVYPEVTKLYDKYLSQQNINDESYVWFGNSTNTLQKAAASINDEGVINHLLAKGAKDNNWKAAAVAIANNNHKSLRALIGNNKDTVMFQTFFMFALEEGREEIVDTLYDLKKALPLYSSQAIVAAAKGGNSHLLAKVIDYYERTHAGLSQLDFAISAAIPSGSVESVKLLVSKYEQASGALTAEQHLNYLLKAIRCNQPYMVSYFIKNVPPKRLKQIHISTRSAEHTHLFITEELEKHHVPMTNNAKAVIAQKRHIPLDYMSQLGIYLAKFTDFIREVILQQDGVYANAPTPKKP
ncbi:hypothetical protein [Legionella waltersii]|uniref:Ankyrin repeat-containing protein n=1 Tax=Legionella waltersii TaxID=66969 RepID=A0A0W0ZZX1_9GAMM|nr:hypothetical protein [Legionella waltersii]KTD74658.1 ankyrin repeat-containing protein [Legionella waltersii]SNV09077.1 ankyrin repeat-containing protein [Legionella waltersii]